MISSLITGETVGDREKDYLFLKAPHRTYRKEVCVGNQDEDLRHKKIPVVDEEREMEIFWDGFKDIPKPCNNDNLRLECNTIFL